MHVRWCIRRVLERQFNERIWLTRQMDVAGTRLRKYGDRSYTSCTRMTQNVQQARGTPNENEMITNAFAFADLEQTDWP